MQCAALLAKENRDLGEATAWEKEKQALPNRRFYHEGGLDITGAQAILQGGQAGGPVSQPRRRAPQRCSLLW